jgi:hypothetical protein
MTNAEHTKARGREKAVHLNVYAPKGQLNKEKMNNMPSSDPRTSRNKTSGHSTKGGS